MVGEKGIRKDDGESATDETEMKSFHGTERNTLK